MNQLVSKFPSAIVFDFDGVLVESVDVKTRAFAALYESYGADVVQNVVAWHLANGGISRYEKFRHFHDAFLGRKLSPSEEKELDVKFSTIVESAVVASPWVPGASQFLDCFCHRLPMYVASGTPENELKRIVGRRGMSKYFRGIFGSPSTKAKILRKILDEGPYDGDSVLMVGDALADYEGAREAGVRFVGRVMMGALNPFPVETTLIVDLNELSNVL